jgi:hypothetical protein
MLLMRERDVIASAGLDVAMILRFVRFGEAACARGAARCVCECARAWCC